MDNENCEGCEWKGNQCMKRDEVLDADIMCPVNCFLPYPDGYFQDPSNVPQLTPTLSDPAMTEAQAFIDFHSNSGNINRNSLDIELRRSFKCGLREEDPPPEAPTKEMLYSLLSGDKYSYLYEGPIKWSKIKPSPILYEIIENSSLEISELSGLLDNDGVDLIWYTNNVNLLSNDDAIRRTRRNNEINEDKIRMLNINIVEPQYSNTTALFKKDVFDDKIRDIISEMSFNNPSINSETIINNIDNQNKTLLQATDLRITYEEERKYRRLKASGPINTSREETSESINIDYNITRLV